MGDRSAEQITGQGSGDKSYTSPQIAMTNTAARRNIPGKRSFMSLFVAVIAAIPLSSYRSLNDYSERNEDGPDDDCERCVLIFFDFLANREGHTFVMMNIAAENTRSPTTE